MPMTPKFIKDGPFPMAVEVGSWNRQPGTAGDDSRSDVLPLPDGSGWVMRSLSTQGVALCFIPNVAIQPSR
jgi:hypothetical protein